MTREQDLVAVPGGYCCVALDRPSGPPELLVVCGHGLSGDRVGPAELLSQWTARLATQGIASLRFDYRGSGDSSGTFATATIAGMVSDYLAVTSWALERLDLQRWICAGISVGGVIAVYAAIRAQPSPSAVLLLSSDLFEFPPGAPAEPVSLRDGEFHLWPRFTGERHRLRMRRSLSKLSVPVGLIYGSDDREVGTQVPDLESLGVAAVAVPGSGHLFESRAARAYLHHATLRFIRRAAYDAARPVLV